MSARALVAVIAIIAAVAAAQPSTCPSTTSATLYNDATCTSDQSAMSSYCTCFGLTYNTATNGCTGTYSSDCTTTGLFAACSFAYVTLINSAASGNTFTTTCTGLTTLKANLISIASGSNNAGAATESSCQAVVCSVANASTTCPLTATTTGTGLTFYQTVCYNPYRLAQLLTIIGSFACNTTALTAFFTAIKLDLAAVFANLYVIFIIVYPACGSISTTYALPVSSSATGVSAGLATIAGGSSWLTNAAAALGVSTSSLTVSAVTVSASRAMWTVLSFAAIVAALLF